MRFVTWAIGTALVVTCANSSRSEEMQFANKNWADNGEAVGISGTMKGDGVAYKNNTYAIWCRNDRKECVVSSIDQVGDHVMGRMEYPYSIPILRWDANEVVAEDEPSSCFRMTLTILRNSRTATWVLEGINQGKTGCDKDRWVHRWSIE
jgi:hypothetical protein